MKQNLLQLEFFHVGGKDTHSLKDLERECAARIKDNLGLGSVETGIKTTVRLYDASGALTRLAKAAKRNAAKETKAWDKVTDARDLRRKRLVRVIEKRSERTTIMRQGALTLSLAELRSALNNKREVAVECPDHTFRPLRVDEAHELLESASRAHSVWVFVFEPNFIYTDKNSQVAHIT